MLPLLPLGHALRAVCSAVGNAWLPRPYCAVVTTMVLEGWSNQLDPHHSTLQGEATQTCIAECGFVPLQQRQAAPCLVLLTWFCLALASCPAVLWELMAGCLHKGVMR